MKYFSHRNQKHTLLSLATIVVAMVTNLVCGIFNDNAIYFGIVNVLIAIVTVWFFKKDHFAV